MKLRNILLAGLLCGAVTTAGAQTYGYLYYAGGSIASGQAVAEDGTLTADGGCFSVLVADVIVSPSSVSVSNWRYATNLGGGTTIPTDNPLTGATELTTWLYIENNVYVYDGRIYVGPGDWNGDATRTTGSAVAYSTINSATGEVGTWTFSPEFPAPSEQAIGGGALVDFGGGNAYLYVVGGNSTATDRVIVSKFQAGGGLGAWSATTSLPSVDWFNRAASVGSTLVVSDGNVAALTSSHYATASSIDGTLGSFTSAGAWSTANRWAHAMVHVRSQGGNDFLVLAGGSGPTNEVWVSQVTAGVPGAWTAGTALPTAKRQIAATVVDDVIIIMGGASTGGGGSPVSEVQVGRINDAGVITWDTSTLNPSAISAMPQARAFGGAAFLETAPPSRAANFTVYE